VPVATLVPYTTLFRSGQLQPVAVEELDAVVLRRVVRGGDDRAEIEREQRDGRRWEHAGEHRVPTRSHDPTRESLLERGPGRAGRSEEHTSELQSRVDL